MKKLQGVPTICAVLALGIAVMVYKFSQYDGPHSFTYILPFDLSIYRMAGEDLNAGGLLYDAPISSNSPSPTRRSRACCSRFCPSSARVR